MTKEITRVLDIGINKGGSYIYSDPVREYQRVGLDRSKGSIKGLKAHFPWVEGLIGDVQMPYLPFKDGSFSHVDILFPHDTLLQGLCHSNRLWDELARVIDETGSITVILDAYKDKNSSTGGMYRSIDRYRKIEIINNPQDQIAGFAIAKGFTVDIENSSSKALGALGSYHANEGASTIHGEVVYVINGERTYPSMIDKGIFKVTNA